MEHSIALVTGATSGVGYAAARTLAGEGWREIIVTGRSLGRAQERPLSSRLIPKHRSSRRWSWSWTSRPAFIPRLPSSASGVGRSISYCSMPG